MNSSMSEYTSFTASMSEYTRTQTSTLTTHTVQTQYSSTMGKPTSSTIPSATLSHLHTTGVLIWAR